MTDMSGTRAIVTGGGQGMGRSTACSWPPRSAGRGARPGRRGAAARRCDCSTGTRRSRSSATSPTVLRSSARWPRRAERFGGIDAVVSNAGTIHTTQGLADTDDDDWDRTMAVHVGGARNLCRAALPHLRRSAAPRVVIVSSMWAQRGPGFGYAYCAAKGALLRASRRTWRWRSGRTASW